VPDLSRYEDREPDAVERRRKIGKALIGMGFVGLGGGAAMAVFVFWACAGL
jgi:hypothetical protein